MLQRKCHHKAGTRLITGIKFHIATQSAGYGTRHRQADARTIIVVVQLYKLLEDMLCLSSRHADTGILYDETHHLVALLQYQSDAALFGELASIIQQEHQGT